MSDPHAAVKETILFFEEKLRKQESEALDTKRVINRLCSEIGEPPRYDTETKSQGAPLSIQADQFYGQALATCMRTILEMRRALKQGPASVGDIYEALVDGGYAFDTKNPENAKRGLRISLMKNTAQFHKLPNGLFGLTEWYPSVRTSKKRNGAPDADEMIEELKAKRAEPDAVETHADPHADEGGGKP